MDMDEIHCKFPKMSNGSSNGRVDSAKLGHKMDMDMYQDEDEDENQHKITGTGVDPAASTGLGRYYNWPSSRIVRVSRASGGKDRHSKVLTSKGLRDRRVRLSVNTAIQFYDLQDRLGYDQPSKAVEWLLKAAAPSIAELPPMNSPFFDTFPETPNSYEKRSSTTNQLVEYSTEVSNQHHHQQQNVTSVTKSCSSNSETSKGSGSGGLSLSRSENRIKARERAKERVQLEKEKETETSPPHHHQNVTSLHPISQATSFTELLNGGISNRPSSPGANAGGNTQWGSAPMDYFSPGLLGRSGQMTPLFEPHQFSFLPDHLLGNNNGSGEYNLNFSISSGNNNSNSSGYNRGTLQSNSSNSSLLPHQLQRFNNPTIEGSQPFFIQPSDNHHQFLSGFDGRLHLSYGDSARRHGKGKN